MQLTATIIADDSFNLNQTEINHIVDALQHSGGIVENVSWLAENKVADIDFVLLNANEAREILVELLRPFKVDFIVQGKEGRRKKLFISDMDSTIINEECIDEIADCLGLKPQISAITERAMNGELDFKAALRERVALLKGLPESKLQEVYDNKITLMKGAKTLVQTMKSDGAKCVLVSGGFTFFTSRIKEACGFDVDESNILEIENEKLKGTVREPILDSLAKLNALKFHCEDMGVSTFMCLASGDGANDIPMIKQAGLGIAFTAKEKVRLEATHHINIPDLTHLLYAQGYKRSEFVEN